ncbi:hypothetical protein Hte_010504 [Hypoxylon texense]
MRYPNLVLASFMANGICANLIHGNILDDTKSAKPEISNGYAVELGLNEIIDTTVHMIDRQIHGTSPDLLPERLRRTLRPMSRSVSSKVYCHIPNSQPAPRQSIETLRSWACSLMQTEKLGPWECRQVACKYNTAIWLCNDNNDQADVNTITVSRHVDDILNERDCETSGDEDSIQGQAFSNENYNVIVSWDSCAVANPSEDINVDAVNQIYKDTCVL